MVNNTNYGKVVSISNKLNNFGQKFLKEIVNISEELVKPKLEVVNTWTSLFKEISDSIKQKNPNSLLNWSNYIKKLSDYFWIIPYKMDTKELFEILKTVNTEEKFDEYIKNYFNKNRVEELQNEIYVNIPRKHKTLFRQIINAYNAKSYSLANTGLMSIIDGLCSYYLINKRKTQRKGIFQPIVEDLVKKSGYNRVSAILIMLDHNIKTLYENINFNKRIDLGTNKKIRRHPNQHGQSYSNQRIDTIMLLNTVYYLIIVQEILYKYKSKLYYENKEFHIATYKKRKEILEKLRKEEKEEGD